MHDWKNDEIDRCEGHWATPRRFSERCTFALISGQRSFKQAPGSSDWSGGARCQLGEV